MQKQNHPRRSDVTDPTPSSPDQNDHQSIEGPSSNNALVVMSQSSNRIPRNNMNNVYVVRHDNGNSGFVNDSNFINRYNGFDNYGNDNHNNNHHHLVPSHPSSSFNDPPIFGSFEDEESLFSTNDILYETTPGRSRSNEFETTADLLENDDKHFQPIPPSPFVYDDDDDDNECEEDYGYHNSSINNENDDAFCVVSKPREEINNFDDSFDLENCMPSLNVMEEGFYSFSPLESSLGPDMFVDMGRHDAARDDVGDDSFLHRSESFASSVLSEYTTTANTTRNSSSCLDLDLDEEKYDFGFMDDNPDPRSSVNNNNNNNNNNIPEFDSFGNILRRRSVSSTQTLSESIRSTSDRQGQCSRFDMEFGDNNDIECHNSYFNLNLDNESRNFITSSRRRVPSGGNDFNFQTNSNSFLPGEQSSLLRKRKTSGEVNAGSENNRKLPRRCSSLGGDGFPGISHPIPVLPHTHLPSTSKQTDAANTSSAVLSDTNTNTSLFSTSDAYNVDSSTTRQQPEMSHETTTFAPTDSSYSYSGCSTFNTDQDQDQCLVPSIQSSNIGNSLFKRPSIHTLPRSSSLTRSSQTNYMDAKVPGSSFNTSDVLNNNFQTNFVDVISNQSQLLPYDNGDISSNSFHPIIPSPQVHASSSFIESPPQQAAAYQGIVSSHPFTVRSSSATTPNNHNEITTLSNSGFHNNLSFSQTEHDTSLPEIFPPAIQKEPPGHGRLPNTRQNVEDTFIEDETRPFVQSNIAAAPQTSFRSNGGNVHDSNSSHVHDLLSIVSSICQINTPAGSVNDDKHNGHTSVDTAYQMANVVLTKTASDITTTNAADSVIASTITNASPTIEFRNLRHNPNNIYTVADLIKSSGTIGFTTDLINSSHNNQSTQTANNMRVVDIISNAQNTPPFLPFSKPEDTVVTITNNFNARVRNSTPISTLSTNGSHYDSSFKTAPIQNGAPTPKVHVTIEPNQMINHTPNIASSLPSFNNSPEEYPPVSNTTGNSSVFTSHHLSKVGQSLELVATRTVHEENQGTAQPLGTSCNEEDAVNASDCCRSSTTTNDPALEKAYNECLRTGSQTCLIKEELKRKILYKRCVQGLQEDPQVSVPSSPSSNQLTAEELVKQKRRRDGNKEAAARLRTRKKEAQEEINMECQKEEERKAGLLQQIGKLEDRKERTLVLLSHLGICVDSSTM